ncbi:unnamed protein product [Clonostachys rhizophaga]|uniref:Glutamine amidotransferase domain-containing protein n=1 Tax=Clonostachys rhizophaga TaxID=160324 RepID=A0A9N9YGK6_9HYPO|nr:unnamed protein product [Clonostachys rhizophaga]
MAPYRVAVLECDTPIQPVLEAVGTYGKIFELFLRKGFEAAKNDDGMGRADVDLKVTMTNVVNFGELPEPENVDAILLTGSKHNAYEDQPWIIRIVDYVGRLYEKHNVRIIGICFGHQIIARALGAEVRKNTGIWEVSVDLIELSPEGRKIYGVEHLALHQMHQDIVVGLPKGAMNIGSSPVCEVQGLHIPRRVFSLQAHPEFSESIMLRLLKLRHDQKIFSDALYKSGIERASRHHDGLLVARAIWKFLLSNET